MTLICNSICFVHCLHGGNVSTWKKGEVFWPYNLLAKNLPEARIISWGYNADVAHFLSQTSANRVKDHAKGLSSDLRCLKGSPLTSTRPIIFVAHSLGGIVCAQVRDQYFGPGSYLITAKALFLSRVFYRLHPLGQTTWRRYPTTPLL